jgi:sortase A
MRFFTRRTPSEHAGASATAPRDFPHGQPSGSSGSSTSAHFAPTTWATVLYGPHDDPALEAKKLRARRSARISAISALILAILGLATILYPFVLQTVSEKQLEETSNSVSTTVNGWPQNQKASELAKAYAYNKKLASSGQPVLGEAVDPFSTQSGQSTTNDQSDSESAKDKTYQSLLNASGDGIMGSIVIPTISVNLPIFHGSSDAVLARGIGHLYGTSLPVGGRSTQSVLTGHRGLVSALMFTRLDELKIGDDFYIRVMGETLGYKIDRISVILPNDTSQLRVGSGEDRITLMTCTPYGVNTHRLLVSGVRASIPGTIPELRNAPSDAKQLAEHVLAIALLIACLGAVIALVRGRKHPVRRHFSGIRL